MRASDHYPLVAAIGIVIFALLILPMAMSPTEEKTRPIDPELKTEVSVRLNRANQEQGAVANIEYRVGQGWYQGWYAVSFFTTLEGELYEVRAYPDRDRDPFILDIKDEKYPARSTWQERFVDVREQAKTGLKTGAEEILKKKEEEAKKRVR